MHTTYLDPSDADLFSEYKPLVDSIAWQFAKNHHQDIEETKANAYLYYVNAVKTCCDNSKLKKRVSFVVWQRLLDQWRKENRYRLRLGPNIGWSDETVEDPRSLPRWSIDNFVEELSGDAKRMVSLCVGLAPDDRPSFKKCLRSMGWTYNRVYESFDEIRKALK